jgi:DNA-binding transcriptional LysR family regulator
VGERAREGVLDPGLAGDEIALGDDDSPPDGPVLEGGADRLEVPGEPGVVAAGSAGSVEREVPGVEAGAGLLLALAGDLCTQSAVSRQVAVTGKAVGTPLFERHARGTRPIPAGEALARPAGTVPDQIAAATQELAGMRDRLAGRLAVAGFPAAAAALLPHAIAKLTAAHPGLRVQLTEASTPAQLAAVRRGRIQVAVVATGDGLPQYDRQGLGLTALRSARGAGVAVAESHPFAVREPIEPGELAGQGWVAGRRSGGAPESGAWPGIAEPVIAFTARDWPTRLGLVAAGLGIALVPGIAAPAVPRGVRWIPVHDDAGGLRRAVWAATSDHPGAAATAMVHALEEEASS